MARGRAKGQSGGINIPGTAGPVGGDIVGRDKYIAGPSLAEIEAKEGRDRLRKIINQFDRRAIRDQMHEENTYSMLASLKDLRVNIQQMGLNTLGDPVTGVLLTEIREDLEEIEDIASWVLSIRPKDDWPDSILDYRIFGMMDQDAHNVERGSQSLQSRLYDVHEFCSQRVQGVFQNALNIDLRRRRDRQWPPAPEKEPNIANIPVNTDRLSKDIFCLYLFGRIDQLKDQVVAKLDKIRI